MNISFTELLDGTTAEMLGDSVGRIKAEKVSRDTLSSILDKVVCKKTDAVKAPARRKLIRLIPVAALLTVIVAILLTAIIMNTGTDPLPGADNRVIALRPRASGDRFSTNGALDKGSFSDPAAYRDGYEGIRFYENGGKTYMIFAEGNNVYEFDGNEFRDTGVRVAEEQFFTSGAYDGYTYVGGVFHCVGGHETGLFRVDLSTGKVEKLIDSDEIVSGVAVIGSKIYYSSYKTSYSIFERREITEYYCLKCADLEAKEIKLLYKTDKNLIKQLKVVDGNLYFAMTNYVCRIDGDQMYTVKTGEITDFHDYAVSEGAIYVYSRQYERIDETNMERTDYIYKYNTDGGLTGSVSEQEKYFVGATCDSLTVYNGKVAAFDENGFYLLDVESKEYRGVSCVDLVSVCGYDPDHFFYSVSKTEYNGRLYFKYGDRVLEYGEDGALTFEGIPSGYAIETRYDFDYDLLLMMPKTYVEKEADPEYKSLEQFKTEVFPKGGAKGALAYISCYETVFYVTVSHDGDDIIISGGKAVSECEVRVNTVFNGCEIKNGSTVEIVQDYYLLPSDEKERMRMLRSFGAEMITDPTGKIIGARLDDGEYKLNFRYFVDYAMTISGDTLPMEPGYSYTGAIISKDSVNTVRYLSPVEDTSRYDVFQRSESVDEIAEEIRKLLLIY